MDPVVTRRNLLAASAIAGLGSLTHGEQASPIRHGRIRQSICSWCFTSAGDRWTLDRLCEIAREFGVSSIELLTPEHFETLGKHRLTCAIASNTMPGGFKTGFNNLRFHEELIERTRKVIDACSEFGCKNVIAFSGFKWNNPDDPASGEISQKDGTANCVKGLKALAAHAEKRGVTICIEHLNTRDDSHPMKGHPGYSGDDLDWLAQIVREVRSPRVKLLFDVYHVQIMHGDVIRRLEQCKDIIGHIHTAGNPGRGELDDSQELNYPAIMRKLLSIKYEGFVGQEFIPTREARTGLAEALRICDV